jgi:hypothetical protein
MSGGMDIDWNARDKLLSRAKERFGSMTDQEIIDYSEWLYDQVISVEEEEKRLSRARHDFLDQQDQIFAILKERKSL